jgi:hypothetical protein
MANREWWGSICEPARGRGDFQLSPRPAEAVWPCTRAATEFCPGVHGGRALRRRAKREGGHERWSRRPRHCAGASGGDKRGWQ